MKLIQSQDASEDKAISRNNRIIHLKLKQTTEEYKKGEDCDDKSSKKVHPTNRAQERFDIGIFEFFVAFPQCFSIDEFEYTSIDDLG